MSSRTQTLLVTGHRGILGHAVVTELKAAGYERVVTVPRADLDLRDQARTFAYLKDLRPKSVIHCAALVGGIHANLARSAEFVYDNLTMQANVIHGAHLADVENLIFFGSNCMYPLAAPQPIVETSLLQGPMEPSNLAYGSAKVAGYVQCQSYFKQYGRNYFTVIPAGLYGPHDNYDLTQNHVAPALILRFHLAKKNKAEAFTVWGTGKPRRELLFSEDAGRGVRLALEHWHASKGPLNMGAGGDLSVREIAETIQEVVGFEGRLEFDLTKPDGNPRKLLDSSQIVALGFKPQVNLREGLKRTHHWLTTAPEVRGVKPGEL